MAYSTLAMSLYRLYNCEEPKVTKEKIETLCSTGRITEEEKNYILG